MVVFSHLVLVLVDDGGDNYYMTKIPLVGRLIYRSPVQDFVRSKMKNISYLLYRFLGL